MGFLGMGMGHFVHVLQGENNRIEVFCTPSCDVTPCHSMRSWYERRKERIGQVAVASATIFASTRLRLRRNRICLDVMERVSTLIGKLA
jgi:hypothetical protein